MSNQKNETVTISAALYADMIDKIDLALAAERLESALLLVENMQDDYFRSNEPNAEAPRGGNADILREFPRYRAITNAVSELLHLIKDDFKRCDVWVE